MPLAQPKESLLVVEISWKTWLGLLQVTFTFFLPTWPGIV